MLTVAGVEVDLSNLPEKRLRTPTLYTKNYMFLLNRIVDRVVFVYSEDLDFEAAIKVQREYRTATIMLTPLFYDLEEEFQRQAFVHELMHVYTDPVHAAAEEILEEFVEPGVRGYCSEQLRKANELTVDDLSRIFLQLTPMVDVDEYPLAGGHGTLTVEAPDGP